MRTEVVFKDGLKLVLNNKEAHENLDNAFRRGTKTADVTLRDEIFTIVIDNVLFYRLMNY